MCRELMRSRVTPFGACSPHLQARFVAGLDNVTLIPFKKFVPKKKTKFGQNLLEILLSQHTRICFTENTLVERIFEIELFFDPDVKTSVLIQRSEIITTVEKRNRMTEPRKEKKNTRKCDLTIKRHFLCMKVILFDVFLINKQDFQSSLVKNDERIWVPLLQKSASFVLSLGEALCLTLSLKTDNGTYVFTFVRFFQPAPTHSCHSTSRLNYLNQCGYGNKEMFVFSQTLMWEKYNDEESSRRVMICTDLNARSRCCSLLFWRPSHTL